jgi:hypothetical protein
MWQYTILLSNFIRYRIIPPETKKRKFTVQPEVGILYQPLTMAAMVMGMQYK